MPSKRRKVLRHTGGSERQIAESDRRPSPAVRGMRAYRLNVGTTKGTKSTKTVVCRSGAKQQNIVSVISMVKLVEPSNSAPLTCAKLLVAGHEPIAFADDLCPARQVHAVGEPFDALRSTRRDDLDLA